MKSVSANMAAHLQGYQHSLATCLKITRKDGVVFGFTDLDNDLMVSAQTYKAASGYTRTAVDGEANLAVPHITLGGLISDDGITESDILNRKFDGAAIEIFQVNFLDLTMGTIPILKGTLARVSPKGGGYTAELVGLTRRLEMRPIVETYTAECMADLADARCKVVLTTYTATVDTVTNRRQFTSTGTPSGVPAAPLGSDPTFFDRGKITWTSAANSGRSMEIRSYDDATKAFVLPVPMPDDVAPGDTFEVKAGCDLKFGTCRDRFDNVVNFRGFPHVPGPDKLKAKLITGTTGPGGGGYPSNH